MERKSENRKEDRRTVRKYRQIQAYRLLARAFVILIAAAVLLNAVIRDRDFSESENRMLAAFPKFTLESVRNGTYMSEFEDYVSDQFFLRDQWISLKLLQDMILGKRESNGVYLCKEGYLMEVPDDPDEENLQKNLGNMADFARRHSEVPVFVCLVPNAFYILKDKLPGGAPVRDQKADLSDIQNVLGEDVRYIDTVEALKEHADEYIYYKTDHHWTSLGARYAFDSLVEGMGISDPVSEYTVYTVADDFQGTLASKSGYHRSRDQIQIYEPASGAVDYVVHYTEEGEKTASIYDSDCLKEKDKYTVFFGGNHARVEISTTQAESRNLLLFKDSYANCMVQFLLPYFQNIVMVDPRYFYDNVDSIMETQNITDVLFLYNLNTFMSDNSIADVLAEQ